MYRRLMSLLVALVLAIGILAPPALAQTADFGVALFVETYRVLRDESLSTPSSESLLRGADGGLRTLLREEGQPPVLPPLTLSGDERADVDQFLHRIEPARVATGQKLIAESRNRIVLIVVMLRVRYDLLILKKFCSCSKQ